MVRFGQVCSGLFGVFGAGFGLGAIWSRPSCVVGLVRFVRGCSGCSGPVSGWALSGRGHPAWSDLVRFGRDWSRCVAPARWVRTDIGRSLVLCRGATVSRCGVRRSETAVGGALMGWVYGQLSWEERCAIARLRGEGCSARQTLCSLTPRAHGQHDNPPPPTVNSLRTAALLSVVAVPSLRHSSARWNLPPARTAGHAAVVGGMAYRAVLRTGGSGRLGTSPLRRGLGLGPRSSLGRRKGG